MATFAIMFVPNDAALVDGMEPKAWQIDAPHRCAAIQRSASLAADHLGFEQPVFGDGDAQSTVLYRDIFDDEGCGTIRIIEREVETLPLAA